VQLLEDPAVLDSTMVSTLVTAVWLREIIGRRAKHSVSRLHNKLMKSMLTDLELKLKLYIPI